MKRTTLIARVLVCLLAMAMLLVTFAACKGDDGPAKNTNNQTPTSTGEKIPDQEPFGISLGRKVKMLGWGTEGDGGYDEQYNGNENSTNAVKKVIWDRQRTLEEEMNFEFDWFIMAGDWSGRDEFQVTLQAANEVAGGDTCYEGVVTYNLNPYQFAYNGLAENMYGHKYLDLTNPWWPQDLNNEILINDTIYSVVENNDYGVLRNIAAMFFNNTMLEAKKLESPYDLVANNQWTISKMSEMVKDTFEDKNGNDAKDKEVDVFGYCGATAAKKDIWFFAMGLRLTTVEDGKITSLLHDPNQNIENALKAVREFLNTPDTLDYDSSQYKMFKEERALFYGTTLAITEGITNDGLEINYGVVPFPKYDSSQERFYTMAHNTHDAWMIPINAPHIDDSCAIIERSSYWAYKEIGPLYFDTYVKLRYAPDERLAGMYDLIRESIVFDFSYQFLGTYNSTGVRAPCMVFRDMVSQPSGKSWAETYDASGDNWNKCLEDFSAMYQAEAAT